MTTTTLRLIENGNYFDNIWAVRGVYLPPIVQPVPQSVIETEIGSTPTPKPTKTKQRKAKVPKQSITENTPSITRTPRTTRSSTKGNADNSKQSQAIVSSNAVALPKSKRKPKTKKQKKLFEDVENIGVDCSSDEKEPSDGHEENELPQRKTNLRPQTKNQMPIIEAIETSDGDGPSDLTDLGNENEPNDDHEENESPQRVSDLTRRYCPDWFDPGLMGLKREGNTCYMNSIIQCLSNIVEMRRILQPMAGGGEIAKELANLLSVLWSGRFRGIKPDIFRDKFCEQHVTFRNDEQHDAHEFLLFLIGDLDKELPKIDIEPIDESRPRNSAWVETTGRAHSAVFDLFYGQIRIKITCYSCEHETIHYEPFSCLMLEIENNETSDLRQCMDTHFDGGVVDWICPSCDTEGGAKRKVDITREPRTLVIVFKRFEQNENPRRVTKKTNKITFPTHELDIHRYLAFPDSDTPVRYQLCAVSNHEGTMNEGHYTAFCKNVPKNGSPLGWHKFDDDDFTKIVDEADIVTEEAYILFYALNRPNCDGK